jgi:hypothetical protein
MEAHGLLAARSSDGARTTGSAGIISSASATDAKQRHGLLDFGAPATGALRLALLCSGTYKQIEVLAALLTTVLVYRHMCYPSMTLAGFPCGSAQHDTYQGYSITQLPSMSNRDLFTELHLVYLGSVWGCFATSTAWLRRFCSQITESFNVASPSMLLDA